MTLSGVIDDFLADIQISRAYNTRRFYANWMRHLLRWVGDIPVSEITPDLLISFIRHMQTNNTYKAGTIGGMLSAISRFFEFLCMEGMIDLDMAEYLMFGKRLGRLRPPEEHRLPKLPPEDAVQGALNMADALAQLLYHNPRQQLIAKRNLAILHTLRTTGARVSEICNMRLAHLRVRSHSIRVIGKGDKERILFFDQAAWDALVDYLSIRNSKSDKEPVFPRYNRNAEGVRPMSTTAIRNVIKRICDLAEVEYFYPHKLRHRFATGLLRATHDLAATQDLMGHASADMTRRYAILDDEHLKDAHREAFEKGAI